jgi:hypothetical protein
MDFSREPRKEAEEITAMLLKLNPNVDADGSVTRNRMFSGVRYFLFK